VTEILPEGSKEKPRTASLFATMAPESVSLEDALQLLSLPRVVGEIDGEEVTAQNGRYGPFLRKGTDSRSIDAEERIFTISLDEARAIFAEPKANRRGQAKPPLRDFGEVAEAGGKKVTVKEGRFGPYVTDGETNASLRRGDEPEGLTIERTLELLAERRAKGPATPKTRVQRPRAKTGKKKTP
jgi:DNA topoisomerase I